MKFFYAFCHLFLMYLLLLLSPYHFCPLLCLSLHEMFPWYLIFLKNSLLLPIILISSISLHCSLTKLSYLSLLFFGSLHSDGCIFPLLYLSLLFFSQLLVRLPQKTIFPVCISFSCRWSYLSPVQCHESLSIVHQALCLSDLVPQIYFLLPLYNHKGFELGHT